jgi:DNA (cytosine-5)-methyltransferase 1
VFENVKGLTLGKHKRFLDELIRSLSRDYDVLLPYRVLNAADYGIPQDRRRLFLIGARKGLKLPMYPESFKRVSVLEALNDLPDAERFSQLVWNDCVEAEFGKPSAYARELRETGNKPIHFGYRRRYDAHFLTSSMRADHSVLSRKRFGLTEPGQTEPISRFHKLDPHGVCNTLRAGTNTDRGAFTSPRPIHFLYNRCITVREAARLHSYPDWFRFHITKWHGFRQIGNSVPPVLARAVASTLVKAMRLRPSAPREILSLGDPHLLSMSLAQAASYYGVPATVIAKRDRNHGREEVDARRAA